MQTITIIIIVIMVVVAVEIIITTPILCSTAARCLAMLSSFSNSNSLIILIPSEGRVLLAIQQVVLSSFEEDLTKVKWKKKKKY